jgi:hypothetical protein
MPGFELLATGIVGSILVSGALYVAYIDIIETYKGDSDVQYKS